MDIQNNVQGMGAGSAPEPEMNPNKIIIPILVAVVVILAGYFVFSGSSSDPEQVMKGGEVTYTDLENSQTKLPADFPINIPIEAQNVKESYKVDYAQEEITQYTIAFTSKLDREVVWKAYSDIFLALGYAFLQTPDEEKNYVMKGFRDGNKLNIAVSPYDSGSHVTINYIQNNKERATTVTYP